MKIIFKLIVILVFTNIFSWELYALQWNIDSKAVRYDAQLQDQIFDRDNYIRCLKGDFNRLMDTIWTLSMDQEFLVFPHKFIIDNTKIAEDSIKLRMTLYEEALKASQGYELISKNYIGKKLSDKYVRRTTEAILQLAHCDSTQVVPSDWELHKLITSNIIPKDIEKAKADLEKGVLSKKLKNVFNALQIHFYNSAVAIYPSPNIRREIRKNIGGYSEIICYDTIPNPRYRPNYKKNYYDEYLKEVKRLPASYDWYYSSEDPKEVTEHYPSVITYYKYESAPEYRVLKTRIKGLSYSDFVIFDSKGSLVAVPSLPSNLIDLEYFDNIPDDLRNQLYVLAWEDNKYDIQSAAPQTVHHVKLQLGLEDYNAAEKAKMRDGEAKREQLTKKAVRASINAEKHDPNTYAGKKAREAAGWAALDALSTGRIVMDRNSINWITQIKQDYHKLFSKADAELERLDECSFKVTYSDSNNKPMYEIVYKFRTDEPYGNLICESKIKRLN